MPLRPMSCRTVLTVLVRHGCEVLRDTGGHTVFVCPCGQHRAPVRGTITAGVVSPIGTQIGLSRRRVVAVTRTATAVREGRFWVVDVPGVGVTQGRSVRDARVMAADLVEAMTGKAEDVDVHFVLPDDVRVAIDHARATTAEAKRLASVAADEYRQAVRDLLVDRGMSKADVAALLQVSQQRVSQLAP